MPTSASIDFNMTAEALITFALKKANVIDALHTPTADEMEDAIVEFNLLLKGLQPRCPNLFRQTTGSATLLASTASYVLSPKPYRVIEARYRDTAGRDLPMHELTRQEYLDMPLKSSTGIPTSYYVDYQRASVTLYVWPVLSAATTETVQYTYQRVIEDIDVKSNDIDVPQEWFETIGYQLAERLADSHGLSNNKLTARAAQLMRALEDSDREAFVRFVPGR